MDTSKYKVGEIVEAQISYNGLISVSWNKATITSINENSIIVKYLEGAWKGKDCIYSIEERIRRPLTINIKLTVDDTTNHWPHTCSLCGGPAYIGFSSVDCKDKCSGYKSEWKRLS